MGASGSGGGDGGGAGVERRSDVVVHTCRWYLRARKKDREKTHRAGNQKGAKAHGHDRFGVEFLFLLRISHTHSFTIDDRPPIYSPALAPPFPPLGRKPIRRTKPSQSSMPASSSTSRRPFCQSTNTKVGGAHCVV